MNFLKRRTSEIERTSLCTTEMVKSQKVSPPSKYPWKFHLSMRIKLLLLNPERPFRLMNNADLALADTLHGSLFHFRDFHGRKSDFRCLSFIYMNAENVIPSWGDFLMSSQTLPGTIL